MEPPSTVSPAVARVAAALRAAGCDAAPLELPASTRTAAEAAAAVGCTVREIAKSLVFRRLADDRAVLAVVDGEHRVDEARLAALAGGALERASPDFVRRTTGYAIGGVPPFAHATPLLVFVDRGLLALPVVWAAAGTPHAVVRLAPGVLLRLCGGSAADFARA